MAKTNKVGLGHVTLSSRERLVLVEPRDGGLVMSTVRSADEVRPPEFGANPKGEADPDMVAIAETIIDRRAAKFDPETFRDRYQDALRELVEAKTKGLERAPQEIAEPPKVINLMDALKRSLAQEGKNLRRPRKPPANRRGPGCRRPAPGAAVAAGGRRPQKEGRTCCGARRPRCIAAQKGLTQRHTVASTGRKPLYTHLYFQVVCAILTGVLLGHFYPALAVKMQPLGEAFIKAIKMLIAPIIFCTVVHGIASMNDMKKVGRVGLKAIVYFEVVTTLALIVGLVIVNLWQPGAGMNVDPSAIDTKSIQSYATQAKSQNAVDYLLHIIPATVVGAFSEGEILQVLFISILFAFALHMAGERGKPVLSVIESAAQVFFGIVGIVMRAAPLGAFGAMAFTIGKYGILSLVSLAELMAAFYTTCLIFVFGVLGTIARLTGFSILRFIRYIKEELLIVLGTSSSEAVLPRMIAKMEILGCDESVVGLVIPTGYSFNLDGTCIYLTMATLFLAQATNTDLSLAQAARHSRDTAADLEGRGGRHRQRLYRSRRHTCRASARSRSPASR